MKSALFALFALVTAFTYWLRHINLRHLKQYGLAVPEGSRGASTRDKLRHSTAYTFDSSRLGLLGVPFRQRAVDPVPVRRPDRVLRPSCPGASARVSLSRPSSISFSDLGRRPFMDIPFDLYGTFRIETRYGFNTTTPGLWLKDFFKSQAIGAAC